MELGKPSDLKSPHRNYQSSEVVGLILRVIVVGKLEDKSETLASRDTQVDVRGVEQASQRGDLGFLLVQSDKSTNPKK